MKPEYSFDREISHNEQILIQLKQMNERIYDLNVKLEKSNEYHVGLYHQSLKIIPIIPEEKNFAQIQSENMQTLYKSIRWIELITKAFAVIAIYKLIF